MLQQLPKLKNLVIEPDPVTKSRISDAELEQKGQLVNALRK